MGANNDSINLSSSVDPICEVTFTAEPVASNLDITTTQSDLKVASAYVNNNTQSSPLYNSTFSMDLSDHLTHQSVSSSQFMFSEVKGQNINGMQSLPFGPFGPEHYDVTAVQPIDFYLSYTGVPALSLISGVYSAEWFISCAIEPRAD